MTVKQRQCLLVYFGYLVPAGIDGTWGPQSARATEHLQKDLDLVPDGAWGPQTDAAVREYIFSGADITPEETAPTGTWWDEIEFFTEEEFMCKCGGRYCNGWPAQMREEVVRICDNARRHFGRPGHVISGLRCEIHNANEGGVENSQHMYGEACDLMIEGVSADQLLAWILTQPGVRYAYKINGTNVHFDVPKGNR